MKQKLIFSAAGLGDVVKGKLYRLAPEKETPQGSAHSDFHALAAPLFGTLSGSPQASGVRLREMLGRNIICAVTLRVNNRLLPLQEAIVTVSKQKNIVSTQVVGGHGTVKEFISDGDMNIAIVAGILATDENGMILDEYPEDRMRDLIEFLDAPRMEIASPWLSLFDMNGGLYAIVVTDYSLQQSTHMNRQVITINALSDYDYTIYYEED
jgi:hypothetical protein